MKIGINALFTSALLEQNYQVISAIPLHLFNEAEQTYAKFIKDHFNKYGQMPTLEWFKEKNPYFRVEETGQPIRLIFDIVSEVLSDNYIDTQLQEIIERGERMTPTKIIDIGNRAKVGSLDMVSYNEFDRSQYFKAIKKVETHIPWFDKNFGGLLGGDLVFIFGRMKSGKTLLLQLLQRTIYKKSDGINILAFSNEIPSYQYVGKFDSMEIGFNPNVFRSLDFSDDLKTQLAAFNVSAKGYKNNIIIAGGCGSADDVIAAYLNMDVKPDLITIDGFELMGKFTGDASDRSASMGANAYAIKRFAVDNNIPVVGTLQGNRGAANNDAGTENVANSDVFARACDILLACRPYQENGVEYTKITTAAFRHGPPATTFMQTEWDKMRFTFYDILPAADVNFKDEEDLMIEKVIKEKEAITDELK